MMVWPSMMSFAPPPVTARRKLPPRLGVPDAPPPLDEELEEELPHAASDPPSTTAPAPTSSSRRESEKESRFSGSSLGVSTMEGAPFAFAMRTVVVHGNREAADTRTPRAARQLGLPVWANAVSSAYSDPHSFTPPVGACSR